MIQPETPVVELRSRLGVVGSIQAWNPWLSRQSVDHAKFWVAKVSSLSYGNDSAKNPNALFDRIVSSGHLSCLEFVPMLSFGSDQGTSLPDQSWRKFHGTEDMVDEWGNGRGGSLEKDAAEVPASAFLVSMPLYTRSQWMRHRSFSYLEMSRRYTKGSKVEWEFYGANEGGFSTTDFHNACIAEYQRRMDAGYPPELARGAIPMEAMTKFWVAGYDRDWQESFIRLRSDAHAQKEIQVFSDWIRDYIAGKVQA